MPRPAGDGWRAPLALLLVGALLASGAGAAETEAERKLETHPESVIYVPSGEDMRLKCPMRDRQGECAWLHNTAVVVPLNRKYIYNRLPDNRDCSLTIRNASVSADDGLWQCQVQPTEIDQPRGSADPPVRLVVLAAPEKPQLKDLPNAQKLAIEESSTKLVVCEVRGGNPSAQIEWHLDGKNITKEAQQSTAGSPRVTQSRLRLADLKRAMNGKNLTCNALHPLTNQSAWVELDVQYVPTVSVGQREYSIVEGSPLSISCQADANPAPTQIFWRLANSTAAEPSARRLADQDSRDDAPGGPLLEFAHIERALNQHVYECRAANQHGVSRPAAVKLNVLFGPKLLNSSKTMSATVGAATHLVCDAEGNPEPEIRWFYADPLAKSAQFVQLEAAPDRQRGSLLLRNTSYRNEGDYFCEARNHINGQLYAVRSRNIELDVFGEPQFLLKSPQHAKVVQGSKSDISLKFCADPAPSEAFWDFGSLRLAVGLNGGQPLPVVAPAGGQTGARLAGYQSAVQSRFRAHPLQTLQRWDPAKKDSGCFEASLSLLDPDLTDQRDYTLTVRNAQGAAQAVVRLRVSSPLSPVLMISSAFVTICGLFLCSLLFVFVFKRRGAGQQRARFLPGQRSQGAANGAAGAPAGQGSQRSLNGKAKLNGQLANGNQTTAESAGAALDEHHQKGVVNGTGNGLANGASNPLNSAAPADDCSSSDGRAGSSLGQRQAKTAEQQHQAAMLSMASSDTSCNDQKQLLASCSERNSASSTNSASLRNLHQRPHHLQAARFHQQQAAADDAFNQHHLNHQLSAASNSTDRSTANSTPSPMNHISVDDELNLNVTYQAAESVTRGAQLSPMGLHGASNGAAGLIYANLDSFTNSDQLASPAMSLGRNDLLGNYQRPSLRRQHQASAEQQASPDSASINSHQQHNGATLGQAATGSRPSVGATIAMMNSLAAAAAAQTNPAGPQSPLNSPAGALNGAINQQLAINNQRGAQAARKPGPPKPPKPSIQHRTRFYQQQAAAAAANNGAAANGLVMIQQNEHQAGPKVNDLAIEYSKIAFPARADL